MKSLLYCLFSAFIMASCAEGPAPVVAPPAETEETKEMGDDDSRLEGRNEETNSKQDGDHSSSTLKFAQSNDSLSMWGHLCEYSKWGKEVHNGHHTLLCPSNRILKEKGKDLIALLKDKKNVAILDKLMASHILKNEVGHSQLNAATVAETIDGGQLRISDGRIGGVKFYSFDIYTQHGIIVGIDDVINFPKQELEKIAAQAQK